MSQLRCKKCGKLWREPVTPGPCGIRVSSTVWCDGELVEHECGGPGEACCMRGCEECGGESLTTMAEMRIEIAQLRARVLDVDRLTRERDEALAQVERLSEELEDAESARALTELNAEKLAKDCQAKLRELEAPPVVPQGWGWEVVDHCGFELRYDGQKVAYIDEGGYLCVTCVEADTVAPWPALVALEYAHRTNQRPHHARNKP